MNLTFPETKYTGPHNEAVETLQDQFKILYNGIEVATLSYCESYQWAKLYAAAPELLEAAQIALTYIQCHWPKSEPTAMLRAAIAKATE